MRWNRFQFTKLDFGKDDLPTGSRFGHWSFSHNYTSLNTNQNNVSGSRGVSGTKSWGAHCNEGANEQNLGSRLNVTKVPIVDQIDKFILKNRVKKRKKQGKRAPEKILPTIPWIGQ